MSKGLGSRQTALLQIIGEHDGPLDTFQLARLLYHPQAAPNERVVLANAQIKATHRALRALLKRGQIEEFGCNRRGRMQWRKQGSRDQDTDKAVAELEATHASNGFAAARKIEWKLYTAMMNHTSLRDRANVLHISKSSIWRLKGGAAMRRAQRGPQEEVHPRHGRNEGDD
jgi:hypothetical protein